MSQLRKHTVDRPDELCHHNGHKTRRDEEQEVNRWRELEIVPQLIPSKRIVLNLQGVRLAFYPPLLFNTH